MHCCSGLCSTCEAANGNDMYNGLHVCNTQHEGPSLCGLEVHVGCGAALESVKTTHARIGLSLTDTKDWASFGAAAV